jgi:hypothetical protein
MVFMVIERFKNGDARPIGERFRQNGRMLPDGVSYVASWIDSSSARCFQIMEAQHQELLNAWISCWDDLIDFEIIPVLTSAEFWSKKSQE